MTLEELKRRYLFYTEETEQRVKEEKYHQGFGYKPGLQEDILEENEAVIRLIEEKEKRLN